LEKQVGTILRDKEDRRSSLGYNGEKCLPMPGMQLIQSRCSPTSVSSRKSVYNKLVLVHAINAEMVVERHQDTKATGKLMPQILYPGESAPHIHTVGRWLGPYN